MGFMEFLDLDRHALMKQEMCAPLQRMSWFLATRADPGCRTVGARSGVSLATPALHP